MNLRGLSPLFFSNYSSLNLFSVLSLLSDAKEEKTMSYRDFAVVVDVGLHLAITWSK
jgi:hypothetical protein